MSQYLDFIDYGNRLSRVGAVIYSGKVISTDLFSTMFGEGLGSASKNIVTGNDVQYYSFYSDRSVGNWLLIETGLCGLLVVLYVFIKMFLFTSYLRKQKMRPELNNSASTFIIVNIIALVSYFYDDTLVKTEFVFPF